jgi:hypothetical protein
MRRFLVITFLLGQVMLSAEESAESKSPHPHVKCYQAPRAWLGLQVSRPDESVTVHLPALPPGIGFMVRSITEGGPAEIAGLKELDVLWKMDDQMLVNEGQLAALLRLSKPGDEVSLYGFRAGKPIEVKLTLGEAPKTTRPFPSDLVDSAVLPGGACGGNMRVFNVSDKVASYSTDEGRAEVRREGEIYKVLIQDPKDEVIFEGDLPEDGNLDKIPDRWKRRVSALRRGLDHALDGQMVSGRQPRPRVIVPPPSKP